jgi:hypothetical protein
MKEDDFFLVEFFVFYKIIINQLLSQVNNIRFFYLTFLIESYFRNGTKAGEVWVYWGNNSHNITQEFTSLSLPCHSRAELSQQIIQEDYIFVIALSTT